MDKLISIKPEIGFEFTANGKTFIVEDKLSIARVVEASKLELELFDLSSRTIRNELIKAYNDLNGTNKEKTVKYADAAVKIHNLVHKIDKNFNFTDMAVLRYCALYINEKEEDRRTITPEQIDEKIKHWQEGGVEISGFFLLVLSVLPGVRKDFKRYMEDISETSQENKDGKK